jgi:glutamate N-acetyltransferase/amino-acid N-acetyltransferase
LSDRLGAPDWERAARAFMTTDTFPKGAGAVCQISGKAVHIAGIAKGSGMIAPNMATMLAYVFTDAAVEPGLLQRLLAEGVDHSLNAITVDGDTSTSDTCMAFATGASGAALITSESDPGYSAFRLAFHGVLRDLAHLVVRDGEGAQKFVEIRVSGAKSDRSAKIVAMSIANSPLIKTAIAAGDANWGRIVMAVGKTLEPVHLDAMTIRFGDLVVAQNGMRAAGYDEARATAHFKGREITIGVDLAVGQGAFTAWTCDLTHGYVDINGAYRT